MDKNIFGNILGGDKAIAASAIEKLYHSPHFTICWFRCGWWCRFDLPIHAEQVLMHVAMFIHRQLHGHPIAF